MIAGENQLVACHECDELHRFVDIPPHARASCSRCGAELYRHIPESLTRSLALYLTALMLLVMANSLPFLSMKAAGIVEENMLLTGAIALADFGMPELGILVFLTSVGFPLLSIGGMLYVLIPLQYQVLPPGAARVYRLATALDPWSLVGVFMLGTLIAFVKLQDLASVIPGPGLAVFAVTLAVYSAARTSFDPNAFWECFRVTHQADPSKQVMVCHVCSLAQTHGDHECVRCHHALHHRIQNSVDRTWALVVSATLMLIPANLYPIMTVAKLGKGHPDTIMSGVISLIKGGMWGLAMIVFFASIVVPVMKLCVLSFLLYSVQKKSRWRPRDRTVLYRLTEVVGAWSMVDIFLVGLLSGLVSLGFFATVTPDIGATFFAGTVVLTMLAAHSFDPRLIWDHADE